MVLIQHLAGMGLVKVVLGCAVPGQRKAGIQVAADHADLRRIALHPGQAVALLEQLFLAVGFKVQRLDLLTVGIGLGTGILTVAEFLANDVHLLAQVVVALAFVHLDIDLIVNVLLNGKDVALLVQQNQQLFKPAEQRRFIQHRLLVLILEQQVGRHILAQKQRAVRGNNVVDNIL